MPPRTNRRFGEIMIGLLLIIAGFTALGSEAPLTLVFFVLGLYLFARQIDRSSFSARGDVSASRYAEDAASAQPRADQVYAHALEAVQRAGLDPAETHVLPVDIGVMAFSADQDPTIYRTRPVLDDVDYIQPFVQLRLPTRAKGLIRFEILDSDGQVMFVHEEDHEFQRGRNLITPAARLPIHDAHAMHDGWHLRVSADGVLIAEHEFAWEESSSTVIRRSMSEDGELSGEVRAMMADSRLQRISLDELLAEQDDDETAQPHQQAGRR